MAEDTVCVCMNIYNTEGRKNTELELETYFVFIIIGCFSCKTTPSCGHSSSWPVILSHGRWRLKNNDAHFIGKKAYCRVEQRRVGSAWAAEESTLGHQILICIHCVLHVLLADQSTEQFFVSRTWQVHAVITLKYRARFLFSLCL